MTLGTNMASGVGPDLRLQPLVLIGATDIYKDPGCSRAIDPDIALSSSVRPEVTMAVQGTQIGMALADTNMATGGICVASGGKRGHGHQYRPQLQ